MVRVCEVKWCENSNETGHSIHVFPPESDVKLRRSWVKFVQVKRANFPHPVASSVICQNHFRACDYQNWGQYQSQFAKRLILRKGAVPSVQPVPTAEQLAEERGQSSTFSPHTTSGTFSRRASYGAQYDDENTSIVSGSKRRRTVNKLQVSRTNHQLLCCHKDNSLDSLAMEVQTSMGGA